MGERWSEAVPGEVSVTLDAVLPVAWLAIAAKDGTAGMRVMLGSEMLEELLGSLRVARVALSLGAVPGGPG